MEHSHKIALAVEQSKNLEQLLTHRFSAYGKGLTEKVKSIEYNLPAELVFKIKQIAKIRNNVVHNNGDQLADPKDFLKECENVAAELIKAPQFKAKPQLKLEVEGYSETFNEFTKQAFGRDNTVWLILGGCIIGGFGIGAATHPLLSIYGTFGLLLIAFLIKKAGYKSEWKLKHFKLWAFFSDRFDIKSTDKDPESSTTVLYEVVKAVRLSEENHIEIKCVDRGVTTNFKVIFKDQETSKASDMCKEIHDLIFRSFDSSEPENHSNGGSVVPTHCEHDIKSDVFSSSDDQVSEANSGWNSVDINDISNEPSVNPATGLPMTGSIDVEGNPYGTDLDSHSRY